MKNNLTLLYVEDEEDTRNALSEVFSNSVDKLYVAKDGAEALEIFKGHHIDFIISDFRMPRMDGNELCSAIKEISQSTYFILLTAYNDTELLTDAINSGVNQFLLKPINSKQLFSLIDDIREKNAQKFQLDRACAYLHDAEKIANLFYWDYNLNTKIMNFQKEASEFFDLPSDSKKEIDYKLLSTMVIDEDRDKFLHIFEHKILNEDVVDEVVTVKNQNSEYKYLRIATSKWKSTVCGDMFVIGLFQDISRYEEQRLKILKESQSDPMLRIDNKKFLISELNSLIKSSVRYGHPVGVLFFDIDDFKHINDRYGHLVADEMLVELVNLIKNNLRSSDYFGRWGGDEFVVVTGHSSPDEDINLAKKLLDRVEKNKWCKNIDLTISVGLAFYEADDDASALISRADFKMLEAKKDGKNRYNY